MNTIIDKIKLYHFEVVVKYENDEKGNRIGKESLVENRLKQSDFSSREDYSEYTARVAMLQNAMFKTAGKLEELTTSKLRGYQTIATAIAKECLGTDDRFEYTLGEMAWLASQTTRMKKNLKKRRKDTCLTGMDTFRREFEHITYAHLLGVKFGRDGLSAKQQARLDKMRILIDKKLDAEKATNQPATTEQPTEQPAA